MGVHVQFTLSQYSNVGGGVPDTHLPRMCEMTFNLRTGESTKRRISDVAGEFPQVPTRLMGACTPRRKLPVP